MLLTSKNMRYFMVLATERSFSSAAKKLNITTSPLNKKIAQLEHLVGFSLFERSPHGVMLNAKGRQLYQQITPIYQKLIDVEKELKSTVREERKPLRIGGCGVYLNGLAELTKEINLSSVYHSVRIIPYHSPHHNRHQRQSTIEQALHGGQIDVMISSEAFDVGTAINVLPCPSHPLYIATPAHHDIPSVLKHLPLVQHTYCLDNPLHDSIHTRLLKYKVPPRLITSPDISQRLLAIKHGLAAGILPENVIPLLDNGPLDITLLPLCDNGGVYLEKRLYFLKKNERGLAERIIPTLLNIL